MSLMGSIGNLTIAIQEAINEVVEAAKLDELTKLQNALALKESFEALQIEEEEGLYFYFGNIDDLREINRKHSHRGGDAALRYFGTRMRQLAETWTFRPYRLGGDSFVIISSGQNKKEIDDELTKQFSSLAFKFHKTPIILSSSFGCVAIENGSDLITTQERAELACAEAKRLGDNRVFMWEESLVPTERVVFRCVGCDTRVRYELPDPYKDKDCTFSCPACGEKAAVA